MDMSIVWISKSKQAPINDFEATVDFRIQNRERPKKYYRVNFSGKSVELIKLTGDYVVFGVCNDRVYFQSGDAVDGYKLARNKNKLNRTTSVEAGKICDKPVEIGTRHLMFDEAEHLYYINIEADFEPKKAEKITTAETIPQFEDYARVKDYLTIQDCAKAGIGSVDMLHRLKADKKLRGVTVQNVFYVDTKALRKTLEEMSKV